MRRKKALSGPGAFTADQAPSPQTRRFAADQALRRRPGGLDQHGAGMGTPMLADPPILRQAKTGLAHAD
nr:hypothetical protein [Mesorhizobium sp.]